METFRAGVKAGLVFRELRSGPERKEEKGREEGAGLGSGVTLYLGHWSWGIPDAQRTAYLLSNGCWLPTQDAWLRGQLPATLSVATAMQPSLECPGAQERDRQASKGLAPTSTSWRGALQGAAGDSSPSELSYVPILSDGAWR